MMGYFERLSVDFLARCTIGYEGVDSCSPSAAVSCRSVAMGLLRVRWRNIFNRAG